VGPSRSLLSSGVASSGREHIAWPKLRKGRSRIGPSSPPAAHPSAVWGSIVTVIADSWSAGNPPLARALS
jgi:hypothetical protein